MKPKGVFIAGTDTGIGKTFVACSLLQALRAANLRATGMKPVASGCRETPDGLRSDDALALIEASDPKPEKYADCNPFAFAQPVSPHIAAAEMEEEVTLPPIEDAYDTIAMMHGDAIVVEGVGGWLAPISDSLRANAIPRHLQLPVILVVGLKLGCLNHAQLSARAIRGDGCELIGWIGNRIDPDMLYPKENLVMLNRSLATPCLGVLQHGVEPVSNAANLRDAADAVRDLK
ncbi:MAG TPA: dethiobiotin synthase [Rhodanobacteraceae bacterium]|nr:dethiobiotin synthase [Rhodanobacteraceae bacterium]